MQTFAVGQWPHCSGPDEGWFVQVTGIEGGHTRYNLKTQAAAEAYFDELMAGPRCVECGDPIVIGGKWDARIEAKMREQGTCQCCMFWCERLAGHGPHVAVVEGYRYEVGTEPGPRTYRGALGHGGAEFRIQFHDGREVVTHNLWAQGRVPEHFRERLPDNAVFVKTSQYEYGGYCGAGSACHATEVGPQAERME